ncbi:hypothetical protein ACRAVF_19090 [Bradyrhizobium oligotrophicum S58]
MIRIPLSLSGPVDAFVREIDAHRVALDAHRRGKPGLAAPLPARAILEALIERVPGKDPAPDSFQVRPYEIYDDGPTLAEMQAALFNRLQQEAAATRNAIISPARLELLNLDFGEALSVTEESRTPVQRAAIEAYAAVEARRQEIARNAALAALEIEELPDVAAAEAWKVPAL